MQTAFLATTRFLCQSLCLLTWEPRQPAAVVARWWSDWNLVHRSIRNCPASPKIMSKTFRVFNLLNSITHSSSTSPLPLLSLCASSNSRTLVGFPGTDRQGNGRPSVMIRPSRSRKQKNRREDFVISPGTSGDSSRRRI